MYKINVIPSENTKQDRELNVRIHGLMHLEFYPCLKEGILARLVYHTMEGR